MSGRPLIRWNEGSLLAQITNRVAALERRKPVAGFYEIKVFADDEEVETGDGAFFLPIPFDLNRARLRYVNAAVSTASGGGNIVIQLHNVGSTQNPAGFNMLSSPITIDSGDKDAEDSNSPWEILGKEQPDPSYNEYGYPDTDNTVWYRQQIRVDVDSAGSGAMGLTLMLGFDG